MTLHDDLLVEPDPRERHRIKVEAFAALGTRSRTIKRGRFTATITGGLSKDARGALSFDVRIDRDGIDITPPTLNPIRIINPPILVEDAAGLIVQTSTDRQGNVTGVRRYRLDLEDALLGVIRDLVR